MAWFRKEKKPRQPKGARLEIPADVWEKCESCGHTDIRENFSKALNVCPACDFHRRIRATDYVNILLDEGSSEETESDLKSIDPLTFPDYPARLKKALTKAGDNDAIVTAAGTMEKMPVNLAVMDFAFMGGSMGSVVGEKIARLGQRSLEKKFPLIIVSASGGARMQEGVLSDRTSRSWAARWAPSSAKRSPGSASVLSRRSSRSSSSRLRAARACRKACFPIGLRVHGRLDGLRRRRKDRPARPAFSREEVPAHHRLGFGRRAHAGRRAFPHADGEDLRRALAARGASHSVRVHPHEPDHGRRQRQLCDAR